SKAIVVMTTQHIQPINHHDFLRAIRFQLVLVCFVHFVAKPTMKKVYQIIMQNGKNSIKCKN
ncbi:hypothetical protein PN477_15295, partial [Spirulina subsalsa CS-330]